MPSASAAGCRTRSWPATSSGCRPGKTSSRALQRQAFDLVLSDYEAGGLEMLRQVQAAAAAGLPLIVIPTGLISEEEAVDCMKAGATDYVFKERVRRLAFSVRRALAEQRQRAALRQAEEDLRALNAELEARVRLRTAELETANAFLNSVIQHIPYQVMVKDAVRPEGRARQPQRGGTDGSQRAGAAWQDGARIRQFQGGGRLLHGQGQGSSGAGPGSGHPRGNPARPRWQRARPPREEDPDPRRHRPAALPADDGGRRDARGRRRSAKSSG